MKGNAGPDLEEEGNAQGMDGLQMREPWPYWDTAPLIRHRKGDAVALGGGEFCGREVGTALSRENMGFASKSKPRGMTV